MEDGIERQFFYVFEVSLSSASLEEHLNSIIGRDGWCDWRFSILFYDYFQDITKKLLFQQKMHNAGIWDKNTFLLCSHDVGT